VYWLLGSGLALWAFVYIVDARNGIGLSIILYSFWFMCALAFFIRSQMRRLNIKSLLVLLFAGIGLCSTLYFAFLQMKINNGWETLYEDAKIAIQIDRYPHWQNTAKMGYPNRDDGQMVVSNNYERVAWATAGLRAIIAYPKGVGVLSHPFARHPNVSSKNQINPISPRLATHSGWVELGLAFGIPMLTLIFSALLVTFFVAACRPYPAQMTVLGIVVVITTLYMVGEVTTGHGIEILFYLLALLPGLLFTER